MAARKDDVHRTCAVPPVIAACFPATPVRNKSDLTMRTHASEVKSSHKIVNAPIEALGLSHWMGDSLQLIARWKLMRNEIRITALIFRHFFIYAFLFLNSNKCSFFTMQPLVNLSSNPYFSMQNNLTKIPKWCAHYCKSITTRRCYFSRRAR